MVALTARMQHERNYDDAQLTKIGLKPPRYRPCESTDEMGDRFLRPVASQYYHRQRRRQDGFEMESGFAISVSSEVMAILAVSKDLKDMRERMANIVVAYDKKGNEVTARDLEVDGAMTAWMVDAINPNLIQTVEGQPVFVHAGPFANIAIGQSSIIADKLGTKLADYHITESGFAADIGFEKFWNLKCRMSGLRPNAVVIVATIRALKMHGGGPAVKPGAALNEAYIKENVGLVEEGCENLIAHIETVKKSGVRPVVCINSFYTDTKAEIDAIRRIAEQGWRICRCQRALAQGRRRGDRTCRGGYAGLRLKRSDFKFLYELNTPLRQRIELIAKEIYGASGVEYTCRPLKRQRHSRPIRHVERPWHMHGKNAFFAFA